MVSAARAFRPDSDRTTMPRRHPSPPLLSLADQVAAAADAPAVSRAFLSAMDAPVRRTDFAEALQNARFLEDGLVYALASQGDCLEELQACPGLTADQRVLLRRPAHRAMQSAASNPRRAWATALLANIPAPAGRSAISPEEQAAFDVLWPLTTPRRLGAALNQRHVANTHTLLRSMGGVRAAHLAHLLAHYLTDELRHPDVVREILTHHAITAALVTQVLDAAARCPAGAMERNDLLTALAAAAPLHARPDLQARWWALCTIDGPRAGLHEEALLAMAASPVRPDRHVAMRLWWELEGRDAARTLQNRPEYLTAADRDLLGELVQSAEADVRALAIRAMATTVDRPEVCGPVPSLATPTVWTLFLRGLTTWAEGDLWLRHDSAYQPTLTRRKTFAAWLTTRGPRTASVVTADIAQLPDLREREELQELVRVVTAEGYAKQILRRMRGLTARRAAAHAAAPEAGGATGSAARITTRVAGAAQSGSAEATQTPAAPTRPAPGVTPTQRRPHP